MEVSFIQKKIAAMARYGNLYVPEFTYGDLRIDAIIIDVLHRWIRGFEIKTNHQDFKKDGKWEFYTHFCSTLTIICPEGLIKPEEVSRPFGLMWVTDSGCIIMKRRPSRFQTRKGLAWLWTYLSVLETEIVRLGKRDVEL